METSPKVIVVTPTYNERGNLTQLVEQIFALKIANLSLVVVDDNSPDGTGDLAEELTKRFPIQVIHRASKEGLGRAYVYAFKEILLQKPDFIIQLDADLSHDPRDIPRMLEAIENYDLVLGSRYTKGGGVRNWNFFRRLISRFGNIYASVMLWIPYRDLTGGFRCFRREVLEKINPDTLSSVGYNFQIELTYRTHKKGFRIREVPIIFTERKSGVSKFNWGIFWESFVKVFWLGFGEKK